MKIFHDKSIDTNFSRAKPASLHCTTDHVHVFPIPSLLYLCTHTNKKIMAKHPWSSSYLFYLLGPSLTVTAEVHRAQDCFVAKSGEYLIHQWQSRGGMLPPCWGTWACDYVTEPFNNLLLISSLIFTYSHLPKFELSFCVPHQGCRNHSDGSRQAMAWPIHVLFLAKVGVVNQLQWLGVAYTIAHGHFLLADCQYSLSVSEDACSWFRTEVS